MYLNFRIKKKYFLIPGNWTLLVWWRAVMDIKSMRFKFCTSSSSCVREFMDLKSRFDSIVHLNVTLLYQTHLFPCWVATIRVEAEDHSALEKSIFHSNSTRKCFSHQIPYCRLSLNEWLAGWAWDIHTNILISNRLLKISHWRQSKPNNNNDNIKYLFSFCYWMEYSFLTFFFIILLLNSFLKSMKWRGESNRFLFIDLRMKKIHYIFCLRLDDHRGNIINIELCKHKGSRASKAKATFSHEQRDFSME